MKTLKTIGLIINPAAGKGYAVNSELARRGLVALGVRQVYTGQGQLGSDVLAGISVETTLHETGERSSRAQTLQLAEWMGHRELDAVVVVGGDGTLADVAQVFSQVRQSPPLLGIGAGSTNAGALITCSLDNVDKLSPDILEIVSLPGLTAFDGEKLIGIGFNDCVLGKTVVATVAGSLRDVGVVEKFLGRNVPARPEPIGQVQTLVWKTTPFGRQDIARGESVGAVVLGLAEKSFVAKAVTGGICLAAFAGLTAGCLVSDRPLVQVELSSVDVLALSPIHSIYTSLGVQERIFVKGVSTNTGLCVDGTPLKLLTPEQEVSFGIQQDVIRTVRFIR